MSKAKEVFLFCFFFFRTRTFFKKLLTMDLVVVDMTDPSTSLN